MALKNQAPLDVIFNHFRSLLELKGRNLRVGVSAIGAAPLCGTIEVLSCDLVSYLFDFCGDDSFV